MTVCGQLGFPQQILLNGMWNYYENHLSYNTCFVGSVYSYKFQQQNI